MGDLAERYFREHLRRVRCKPGHGEGCAVRVVERHILPRFGNLPVSAIGARGCRNAAL